MILWLNCHLVFRLLFLVPRKFTWPIANSAQQFSPANYSSHTRHFFLLFRNSFAPFFHFVNSPFLSLFAVVVSHLSTPSIPSTRTRRIHINTVSNVASISLFNPSSIKIQSHQTHRTPTAPQIYPTNKLWEIDSHLCTPRSH
jgi:hypothetical protein